MDIKLGHTTQINFASQKQQSFCNCWLEEGISLFFNVSGQTRKKFHLWEQSAYTGVGKHFRQIAESSTTSLQCLLFLLATPRNFICRLWIVRYVLTTSFLTCSGPFSNQFSTLIGKIIWSGRKQPVWSCGRSSYNHGQLEWAHQWHTHLPADCKHSKIERKGRGNAKKL